MNKIDDSQVDREVPVEIPASEFKKAGHKLVDDIAHLLSNFHEKPVSPGVSPEKIRTILGQEQIPSEGESAIMLLEEVTRHLIDNSTFNGHPRFWGYITSSATPIGVLADFLAAAINPNVGGWDLSPIATEIEKQTLRWIAEMIGYPTDCGGILVSGGNMANFAGFLAARTAKSGWNIREKGLQSTDAKKLTIYVSAETHTWIQKAADLYGHGTDAIRWIKTDIDQRMDPESLREQIEEDKSNGYAPFIVVGTAGTVRTGAIDPLREIASICKQYDLWFHIDGAYGAFAAVLPEAHEDMKVFHMADSIALDPHKWLYSPLEAGCALVKNADDLLGTFRYHPEYYHFSSEESDPKVNYYEYGFQNSRGFRALKVWLSLKHAGKSGYIRMIRDDIQLAEEMAAALRKHPDFEVFTTSLSITTFRFRPSDLTENNNSIEYLNKLNKRLLDDLQKSGELFVSNAVINGIFLLRACIVNFRTSLADVQAVHEIVAKLGERVRREVD